MSGYPLRIGYCLSLTGPLASNGKTARLAHEIWEDVNRKGTAWADGANGLY